MTHLKIIEQPNKQDFIDVVESFIAVYGYQSIKFQRNLYYAGIGSSAGRTPGSITSIENSKLEESYVAFIIWTDVSPTTKALDTRFRD